MKKILDNVPLIQKESIHLLTFPNEEVLKEERAIQHRLLTLHRATGLGNLNKHKVNILFEDKEGVKRVNTTIWAMANRKIFLKDQRTIPIHRIHGVALG